MNEEFQNLMEKAYELVLTYGIKVILALVVLIVGYGSLTVL